MGRRKRWQTWLESRWVSPAFGGGVLLAIGICFFGAATNTMAGWLYVISGLMFALLALGAILPGRSLRDLKVERQQIPPVSVGDLLRIEVKITNPTPKPKLWLQYLEAIPPTLGTPNPMGIEIIPPQKTYNATSHYRATRRGVYRWPGLFVRTASPLGLFWSRRWRSLPAQAIVYPQILPLRRCPLIDSLHHDEQVQWQREHRYEAATEGITKALRPYRFGDPTRLIHWRTSARFGMLQVRELEILTSGREMIIGLDTAAPWLPDQFEDAVTAAASLYFYASRAQLGVSLWTATTGAVQGNRVVLETLAATECAETATHEPPRRTPLLWLTANPQPNSQLPQGSLTLLFVPPGVTARAGEAQLLIRGDRPLTEELSQSLPRG